MKTIFNRTVRTITLALLCSLILLNVASAAERYFIQVGAYAQQQYVAEELQKLDKAGITGQQGATIHGLTSVYFGEFATIKQLPAEPTAIPSGAIVRVLMAKLDRTGEEVLVPRANVELV